MSIHKITRKCSIYVDGKMIDASPGDTISFTGPEPIEITDKYLKSCLLSFDKLLELKSCKLGGHSSHCSKILHNVRDSLPFDSSTRSDYTNAYIYGIADGKVKFDAAKPVTLQLACYIIHGVLTAISHMPDITGPQYKDAITYCIRCLELTPEFYNVYKSNIGGNNGSETG